MLCCMPSQLPSVDDFIAITLAAASQSCKRMNTGAISNDAFIPVIPAHCSRTGRLLPLTRIVASKHSKAYSRSNGITHIQDSILVNSSMVTRCNARVGRSQIPSCLRRSSGLMMRALCLRQGSFTDCLRWWAWRQSVLPWCALHMSRHHVSKFDWEHTP